MIETPGAATVPVRTGTEPHCVEFRDGKRVGTLSDLDAISDAIAEHGRLIWLDLVSPSEAELALLQREFDLHPLAIEDAQTPHERPKIETYERYVFLIVHPTTWEGERLVVHELAIFAGHRFLVTIHRTPAYPIDAVERRWHSHDGEIGNDAGFLLYALLDTIVDDYFPVADRIDEWVNALQAGVFDPSSKSDDKLHEVFLLRQDVHQARRAVAPMREILQPIVRGDFRYFARDEIVYYRDVYDHAIRVIDQLDSARESLNSALEVLISLATNRQGEVSKQLTVIATIFLPLTYITGFFGQNFGYMVNGITSAQTFWALGVGTQVATLAGLLLYFRAKRWF
jgi:magnesium transporter